MTILEGSRYQSYVYGYPHKTAYRKLDPPLPLGQLWADEPRTGRFLYVHVPFCEARCGFCNLFTQHRPPPLSLGPVGESSARRLASRSTGSCIAPTPATRQC